MAWKDLTLANWTEPDPTSMQFGRISPLVGPVQMDGQDWARVFLAIELGPQVPADIHDLFGVARGALLYGWFYYPLFRLGEEQLYRVCEAAAKQAYRELGGTRRHPSFAHVIDWLIERRAIAEDDRVRWHAARELRNLSSHPERQSVMPPGTTLRMAQMAAHDINRLFARMNRPRGEES